MLYDFHFVSAWLIGDFEHEPHTDWFVKIVTKCLLSFPKDVTVFTNLNET
jgi:hypothetical protein